MNASSVLAGLRMGAVRLAGTRAIVALVVALGVTVLAAALERSASTVGAADRSLAVVFRFVVPISAIVLSGLATGTANLRDAAWAASRFGHPRAGVGVGIVLSSLFATAALSLLLAVVALLVARVGAEAGRSALSLPSDLFTSSWIAVLAGASYAAWFGLAATFGARGGWRVGFLLVDLFLGGVGAAGAVLPRGSVTHLIGGESPLDLPQAATSAILVALTLLCLALGSFRCRD